MRCLDILSSVAGCFTLPLFKAGQLVQQWVASSSLLAGAGWWAARVIGRENSVSLTSTPPSSPPYLHPSPSFCQLWRHLLPLHSGAPLCPLSSPLQLLKLFLDLLYSMY